MRLELSGSDSFALLGIFSKQVHVSDKSKSIVGQRGVEIAAAGVAAKDYNRLLFENIYIFRSQISPNA